MSNDRNNRPADQADTERAERARAYNTAFEAAAKMNEANKALKATLGPERFENLYQQMAPAIRDAATQHGLSIVAMASKAAKEAVADNNPSAALGFLAIAAEMVVRDTVGKAGLS
jgi:hypothetical protein